MDNCLYNSIYTEQEDDKCNGSVKYTDCVIQETPIITLGVPANSTQTEVNSYMAIYIANLKSEIAILRQQIGSIDTGSEVVAEATYGGAFNGTLALNTLYGTYYDDLDLATFGSIPFTVLSGSEEINPKINGNLRFRVIADGMTELCSEAIFNSLFTEKTENFPSDRILTAGYWSVYIWKTPDGVSIGVLQNTGATPAEDTTPPVITLNGASTINLYETQTYTELGATATDNVDGSVSVTIGGDTVDTNTIGVYEVTYDAVDAAGNNAVQVIRTVNVIADNVPPVITLTGNSTINVTQNGTYAEQGATASDNVDGDISGNIIIGGDTVDEATIGVYVITYNVSDTAGNAAIEVTRTVNVTSSADTTAPATPIITNVNLV